MLYTIATNMPGYLSESDAEPFDASPDEAIEALLDEAEVQLGDPDDEADPMGDELYNGDTAVIELSRGSEGRGDLLFNLETFKVASIWLDSYANGFGAWVVLREVGADAE
jgi:hypothetical protein